MKSTKEKILITGGAGFIGSNLCEYFLSKGYAIVCLDNFSTGYIQNIQEFLDNPNFTLLEGDIRNFETCKKATYQVDFVLHHAALGSVPRSIENPVLTNEVNVSGFLNILTAARDARTKRFVYAASSSTYGDSEELPKIENIIGKPLSPYAITKYVNELYAEMYSKTYGIETIGLRYFNVFGKKQDPNGAYAAVIPKFAIQLINHETPIINGDGSYTRDYVHIDNILLMNELAITTKNPNAINTIYNAANGEKTNLTELAEQLKENLAVYDSKIASIHFKYATNRLGDIPHSVANIDKARILLGYSPVCSAKEGFKKATKWYFSTYKKP